MRRAIAGDKSYVALLVCPRCGKETGVILDRTLNESLDAYGRYADTEPCDVCKEEVQEMMDAVDAGGLAFVCKGCDREGAIILSDSSREFVTAVRKRVLGDREDWETARLGIELPDCSWHERLGIPGDESTDDTMEQETE